MNDRIDAAGSVASASNPAREYQGGATTRELEAWLASSRREVEELRVALGVARASEQLLRHELQHRVRNMLAVIRSIFRRTRETGASQDELAEHFEGRLNAIARSQSMLSDMASNIELEDIVRDELLEAGCGDGPMCTIAGPPVLLSEKTVELISLAVHELTTNSIKFGALAHHGRIRIEWSVDRLRDETRLHFRWTESGVPIVATAPRARGFGRQLIEEALPYQLGAVTSFDLKPGGLDCSIVLTLSIPQAVPDVAGDLATDDPDNSLFGSE